MTRSILREYSLLAWAFAFGTDSTGIVAYKYHNWPYAVSIQKSGCHSSSEPADSASLIGILRTGALVAAVIVPSASPDYVIAPADFYVNASKRTVMAKI